MERLNAAPFRGSYSHLQYLRCPSRDSRVLRCTAPPTTRPDACCPPANSHKLQRRSAPKMLGVHDISTSHPSTHAPHRRPSWLHADHRRPRLLWPPHVHRILSPGYDRLSVASHHVSLDALATHPVHRQMPVAPSSRSPLLSTEPLLASQPAIHPVRRTCCYRCRYAPLAHYALKLVDAPLSWVSPLALTDRALQTYVRSIEAWQCATLVLLGRLLHILYLALPQPPSLGLFGTSYRPSPFPPSTLSSLPILSYPRRGIEKVQIRHHGRTLLQPQGQAAKPNFL